MGARNDVISKWMNFLGDFSSQNKETIFLFLKKQQ